MKIATKISLSFLVTGVSLTVVAITTFYMIATYALHKEIIQHLDTASQSRKDHIETYLRMIEISVTQLSKSGTLESFLKTAKDDPRRKEAFETVMKRLKRTKEVNPAIYEFILLDKNGMVVASSSEASIGQDKSADAYFTGGQKGVYIKDAYYSEATKKPLIGTSAPVTDSQTGELLGVLAARIELDDLNGITTDRTGLGKTGEIYLVNKHGYMITPSRFLPDTFLEKKVDTQNYRACASELDEGKEHPPEVIGTDYRGRMTLGTHACIHKMEWFLLAEMDMAEANAPLRMMLAVALVIIFLIPFAAWLAGVIVSGAITAPIHRLHRGTEIIGSGDLDYKVGTLARDEIGQLSRAFDTMTQDIRKKIVTIDMLDKEIAERKRAEEAMREKEERFRAIFNTTFQFTGLMTPDGILIEANQSAVDFTGLKQEDVINRPFWETHWWRGNEERVQKLKESIRLAASGKFIRYETELQGSGDTTAIFDFSIKPAFGPDGKVAMLVPEGRDITERKKAEEKMARLAAQNKLILESAADGIVGIDSEGRHIFANPAAVKMFGYKAEELIDKPSHSLWHHTRAAGSPYPKEECPIYSSLRKGTSFYTAEEVFWRKDGSSFPVEYTTTPIKEGDKNVGTVIVFRDITDRKASEAKVAEAMEVKSQFLSMVSHELRTPMTAIKEGIGIVLDGSAGAVNEEQKDFLDTAKRNVDRLSRLINDVLDYQKLEAGTTFYMRQGDIGVLINEVVKAMLPVARAKNISLEARIAEDLPRTIFDIDKLTQVLINLVNNAIKFTDKGAVTVTAAKDNSSIVVSVKDTGIGIKKEDIPKLFQDFFQLDEGRSRKGGSTGLGLAISKKIIHAQRGEVWVESEPGKGSDFKFKLPIKTKFKVLAVDDDKNLLDICRRSLEKAGYDVAFSESGLKALEMIEKDRPDMLLLDMKLLDINGYEIIGRLRSSKATFMIPILAMSGYPEELAKLEDGREDSALASIAKPFRLEEMISLVRVLLRQGS